MAPEAEKTILVTRDNGEEFRITVPENSTMTFGPWSPPKGENRYGDRALSGTLRVYRGAKQSANQILAVFSGVASFRDVGAVNYAEKVAVEEGATLWKSDQNGYERSEKVQRQDYWTDEEQPAPQLTEGKF